MRCRVSANIPMGHLFLNKLDERFDPDKDRVAGPWCLIDTGYIDEDWSAFEFIEPFATAREEISAAKACAILIRFHLLRLADSMNERHATNRSFPFWWSLLTAWLQHLVESSWRQWCHVERLVERDSNRQMSYDRLATDAAMPLDFVDTRDFVYRGLKSPAFVGWMMSDFVDRQRPDHWAAIEGAFFGSAAEPPPVLVEPPVNSNVLKRSIRKMFRRLPAKDLPGVSGGCLMLSAYISMLPRRSKPSDFLGVPAQKVPAVFPPAYLDALDALIEKTMPRSFAADFRQYDAEAAKLPYRTSRLFATAPTIFEDRCSFEIAHAVEAGERVVRVQHGSEYGTAEVFNIGWMNEFVNAGFLTWGWTDQSDFPGRFLPVSAPPLAGLRNAHRQKSDSILLIGTAASLVPFRIVSALKPSIMDRYVADKATFVNALHTDVAGHLIYRPYRRAQTELSDVSWLKDVDHPLELHSGSLTPDLLRCRLAVIDHPGTTLNITLAANTPTVCFWRPELVAHCNQARYLFDQLREVGVLYDDAEAAAYHINHVAEDVASWWQRDDTQSARRQWADAFARTDRFWWWSWLTALRRV